MKESVIFRIKRRILWDSHRYWDVIYRLFCFSPNVMSYQDTINSIVCEHKSLARFGDGELSIMYGGDLNFQKSSDILKKRMREVAETDDKRILIGIPDIFDGLQKFDSVQQSFWKVNLYFNRSKWYSFLKKDRKYADAFLSRFYSMEYDKELSSIRVQLLRTIWQDRNVIFVEGKDTKLGVGNDLFDNVASIRRILCPAKDAFSKYGEILKMAKAHARPDDLFILALGPTATVLAYDLCMAGHQALDLGHLDIEYEWYKMGATSKVPVTGKFTNEAVCIGNAFSEVIGSLQSTDYDLQIVELIV